MKKIRFFAVTAFSVTLMLFTVSGSAETSSQANSSTRITDPKSELDAAFKAASAILKRGPTIIPLVGQVTFNLPVDYAFVPSNEAQRLLVAMGNHAGEGLLGMIFPTTDPNANWFIVVRYVDSGYIKDDDAKDWNIDELLESIRDGTEESNKERSARGIPEMEVIGWIEKPQYEATTHRMFWSISSRDKGVTSNVNNGVNYNTMVLGREGFISMNLVTDVTAVEGLKPVAKTLLTALSFNEGKRYTDFNSSTDKVAEYGLAAIVAGVAAKKLGLFALAAAFVAKFAKVIGIAVIAGGGAFAKSLWKRKKNETKDNA